MPPLSPDPRPAVLDFARFLGARGIRLVLFPVPDKASLQPLELHGRARDASASPPRATPTRAASRPSSRAAGVLVFDPTPAALRPGEPPRFHAAGHPLDAGLDGGGRRRARASS